MKYYVSLVDHDQDVAKLEVAAKQLYREVMLIKQDALCRLENDYSMVEVLQASYNLNEMLHNVVGGLAAKYTRPLELDITEVNFANGMNETDLSYVLSYNVIALKAMAKGAVTTMLGNDAMSDLLGIGKFLGASEIADIESAMVEFFNVVQSVFEKQATEFIEHAVGRGAFTATGVRCSALDMEPGGVIQIEVVEK